MRYFTRRSLPLAAVLLLVGLLFGGTLSTSPPSFAHPDGPPHHNPLPEHATDVMKRQREDAQPPQNLQSMSTTTCTNGFAGAYPCNNVDLEAFMPLADIGGTRSNSAANDIWGWTDPQTGKEYAIIGRVFGTSFVDISNPANPVFLGELVTHGAFGSSWRDIKTYANHAFIVSEANQHGMQVFDLTQLRNVTNPPVTFSETAHYNKNASAHNIVINEASGFAYIVGAAGKNSCSGGLHMVNIQNPTNPTFAGCFSSDGYTHDAQCVIYNGPDAAHQGKEICFNSNEDTVTIVDVSNKNSPIQLSRTGYSGAHYTHQGWLTEDQHYFLLDDELDEQNAGHNTRTRIFNVSDLDSPSLVGFFDNTTPAIDHNLYIKGSFAYQANYRSGLRILDISGVASGSLSQVAYFDIYPADDNAQFNAAWSNYPYFNSGIVIVSGIEQGLFILRPTLGSVDNPPTVNVTDPAEGATVSGNSVLVAATASDDNGVNQVEFFVDGISIGVDTSSPYSVTWDSTTAADGAHTVSATATDTIGQTASDSNNVTVDNDAPPTATLTNPAEGSTVSGTISVTADATDDQGVSQVEFFVDGASIGVDASGGDGWSASWDTTTVANGGYTVSATATDTIGQTGSDSNSVTVNNDSPPSVTVTNPAEGATVSGLVSVTADANDDQGVSQVEFFVDGASIGVDADGGDGWSASWDTTTVGNGGHTVSATATDTIGQTASDSNNITVDNAGITLNATGYKVQGVHHADLTWSGATSTQVDIYRDGALIATVANSGAYTDNTGQKGGNVTYIYQVCEAGTSICSNEAAVSF